MINEKRKKIVRKFIVLFVVVVIVSLSFIFKYDIEKWINFAYNPSIDSKVINSSLQVHFIDVGQGDAIAIKLPDEKIMLVDTGTEESSRTLINYINNNLVTEQKVIDYLILTHHHEDHIGGAVDVLKEYEVKNIYRPKVYSMSEARINNWYFCENELYDRVIKSINTETYNEFKSNIIYNSSFRSIVTEEYSIKFLSPQMEYYEVENNYSAVLLIQYMNKSIILTGDAEKEVEQELIDYLGNDLSADILKLGHHGSNTSSCQEFLECVSPKYAVISCGRNNKYGHPSKSILERVENIGLDNNHLLRTDNNGNIVFGVEADKINIYMQYTYQMSIYIAYEYVAIIIVILSSFIIFLPRYSKKDFKKFFKKITK